MTETSPPNEIEFIATRALELMGGREKAFAAMEADYDAMKERWNQDTDSIGRILRAHLYLEHYLTEGQKERGVGDVGALDAVVERTAAEMLELGRVAGGVDAALYHDIAGEDLRIAIGEDCLRLAAAVGV